MSVAGNVDAMTALRVLIAACVAVALTVLARWLRDRRVRAEQEHQRTLYALAEEIFAAPTPKAIAEKLAAVVPALTQATSVNLFVYQRRTRSLERLPTPAEPEPMAASLDAPPEGLASAAVICFRNRTPLQIPDVRRNPLVKVGAKMNLPRSAMFIPLLSQQEVLGVLELGNARGTGFFTPKEQADAQHIANQTAAALRFQERQTTREQLLHSEKLAASGQLISGVATELKAPIESIVNLAASLAAHAGSPPSQAELVRLSGESQRASEIVARLVSFAHDDDSPSAANFDVHELAAELIRFREPEWKSLGIEAQQRLATEPAQVMGFRRQIEQALLNLIVHAERRAARTSHKTLSIQGSSIANRILLEIGYSTPDEEEAADPFSAASVLEGASLGLAVCQGIIRSHGGDVRFRSRGGLARFEVELPLVQEDWETPSPAESRNPPRALTVMLVDPDPAAQTRLLSALAARGHRGIPAAAQEASELVQRLRFDAVFWALGPFSRPWTEFYEEIRGRTATFVLVSDGWDPELARRLEENHDFLLTRPVQDAEMDRILTEAEVRSRQPSH